MGCMAVHGVHGMIVPWGGFGVVAWARRAVHPSLHTLLYFGPGVRARRGGGWCAQASSLTP